MFEIHLYVIRINIPFIRKDTLHLLNEQTNQRCSHQIRFTSLRANRMNSWFWTGHIEACSVVQIVNTDKEEILQMVDSYLKRRLCTNCQHSQGLTFNWLADIVSDLFKMNRKKISFILFIIYTVLFCAIDSKPFDLSFVFFIKKNFDLKFVLKHTSELKSKRSWFSSLFNKKLFCSW